MIRDIGTSRATNNDSNTINGTGHLTSTKKRSQV